MSSQDLPESALQEYVLQSQDGDTDAFGKIYDHFFTAVYRYTSFRVPKEMAEDLVADIFVKAWEKIHTYKSQKKVPFSAWLFRIARHSVIDAYRSQKHIAEVPEEVIDEDPLNQTADRVTRQHLVLTVRTAMKQLPDRYREVLELSFMAELPNNEVARVLRIREGATRTLKSRALKKLEQLLPVDV